MEDSSMTMRSWATMSESRLREKRMVVRRVLGSSTAKQR